ncbi:MAG: hypothetical protein ACE5JE_08620 [Thermoplasmata archaeon]
MTWAEIQKAKARHEGRLLRKRNVVGLAVGKKVVGGEETDELCLVVLVREKLPEAELSPRERIPKRINDVTTDVVEAGELEALGQRLRVVRRPVDRWRPAPGGVSLAHGDVSAGTLGCVVRRDGEPFILSNSHILSDSGRGTEGDPILQPAPEDGGRDPVDVIAHLAEFVPLRWRWRGILRILRPMAPRRNRVDCALARPVSAGDLRGDLSRIGPVEGVATPFIGQDVRKSGRTTGLTRGRVTHLDATVTIRYEEGREALFTDQIITTDMSKGGDSGALVVDDARKAVGLLFAGSQHVTVLNRISTVLSELRAEIVPGRYPRRSRPLSSFGPL